MRNHNKLNNNMFTRGDFHWKASRFVTNVGNSKTRQEQEASAAIEILNNLSDEQKQAVELYARSRYQDGLNDGYGA